MMSYLDSINEILWHPAVLYVLLATGVLFTIWSRFSQFKAVTHGIALIRGHYDHQGDPGAISHFQALSAALSATVGLGNIAGVALAIAIGGPGAVFWLWIVGFIGMALKTTEVIQSMIYRNIEDVQNPHGGPMWVCLKGFREKNLPQLGKFLGAVFCVTLLISGFTGGNMFQAWNVADITFSYFAVPKLITGIVLTVLCMLVIVGGIKRIGNVAGALVPFMCLVYVISALTVILTQVHEVPHYLWLIVKSGLPEFLGGVPHDPSGPFLGATIGLAFTKGMQRALFSNEAGQGSAPIAHSAARTNEPASEGIVAGLEPFIDTLCVCTMTALVILLSGVWNRDVDFRWNAPTELQQGLPVQASSQASLYPGSQQDVFAVVRLPGETQSVKWPGTAFIAENGNADLQWSQPLPQGAQMVSLGAYADYKGATLTARAFDRAFPGLGQFIVPLTVWLFALSTMISWSYYGEQGAVFLWGEKSVSIYRWIYCLSILVSTSPLVQTEGELDIISSLGTGVMLWVNIPLMLIFGSQAMSRYFEYVRRIPEMKRVN